MDTADKITPILDLPSKEPDFRFTKYADKLSDLLTNAEPARMTVGIFGGYGTGKTTLMECIAKKLKDKEEKLKDECKDLILIGFNAWRHEKEKYLFLPLLSTILNHIKKDETLKKDKKLLGYFCAIFMGIMRSIEIETGINIFKIKLSFKEFFKSLQPEYQRTIEKITENYLDVYDTFGQLPYVHNPMKNKKFIIFIDDLDRCLPDKAFNLIESIKSFLDMQGFIFIFGLDSKAISPYISRKFKCYFVSPQTYFDKIFQISFYLPKIEVDDIKGTVTKILKQVDNNWSKKIIARFQISSGEENLTDYMPKNMRKIKKILNMHQIITALSAPKQIDSDILLAILIVQSRWPKTYWLLHKLKKSFHDFYKNPDNKKIDFDEKEFMQITNEWKENDFPKFYDNYIHKKLNRLIENIIPYLDILGTTENIWPIEKE